MKCVLVNRNYPPAPGMTGHSANELAAYLVEHGVEVHVVCVSGGYAGGGLPDATASGTVYQLRALYSGKHKLLRLLSSLWEGYRMARKAASFGISPVIALTDPPLLNFWVTRYCRKKRLPWFYWAMDLYPEAFHAAGLSSTGNPVYRFLYRQVYREAPPHLIALGPRQAAHLQDKFPPIPRISCLPAGVMETEPDAHLPEWANDTEKIVLGYVGNLGEAHSAEFVREVIEALDPQRHIFVFKAYGAAVDDVLPVAQASPAVHIPQTLPHGQLPFIDVQLISLKPGWDHICVPSKAVSAVCNGSAIFFHGSGDADSWHLLGRAGWRIDPQQHTKEAVHALVDSLTPESVQEKRTKAREIRSELETMKTSAFAEILESIRSCQ